MRKHKMQTFDLSITEPKIYGYRMDGSGKYAKMLVYQFDPALHQLPILRLPVQACVRMRGNALRQVTFLLFFLLFSGCDCNIRLFTNLEVRYYGLLDGCIKVALGCLPLPNKGRNW